MEKEFVTYELSKRLYLLGYNERNIYHYCNGLLQEGITYNSDDINRPYESVSAPLYQQAFRWFREKYKLNHIWLMDEILDTGNFSYDEAETICLKHLIEFIEREK